MPPDSAPALRPRRLVRSLKIRVQLGIVGLLAVVVIAFGAILYLSQRLATLRAIDAELESAVLVLAGRIEAAGDAQGAAGTLTLPETFEPRRVRHAFEEPFFLVYSDEGHVLVDGAEHLRGSVPLPNGASQATALRNRRGFREAYRLGAPGVGVIAGRFVEPEFRRLRELLGWIVGAGVLVVCVGAAGGWWLAERVTRPLSTIASVADSVSEEDLSARVETAGLDDELAALAGVLNRTFDRLEAAFERQRRFTSDASHELRTPLAVLSTHQQLALAKERTPAEYRAAFECCARATTRMQALVQSLLQMARGEQLSAGDVTPIDLADIARVALEETTELATERRAVIDASLASAVARGIEAELCQAVENLLVNALLHNPPGVRVTLTTGGDERGAFLTVRDNGVGIPADDLPHLFERFYRVDTSRTGLGSEEGFGLGLSLCELFANRSGGEIEVQSEVGVGTTFTLRCPGDTAGCSR